MRRGLLLVVGVVMGVVSVGAAPAGPVRGFVQEFDSVVALLNTSPTQLTTTYTCKGLNAINDGLGGQFYYFNGDTTATNATDCFAWGSGRLRRFYEGITAGRISVSGGSTNYLSQAVIGGALYDVRGWGAKCDGVTDDTAALQEAIDALGPNSRLWIPIGTTTLITGTITIANDRVHIEGGGAWATKLIFTPASDNLAMFVVERTGDIVFQGSFSGITVGTGNARPKTGIRLIDTSEYVLDDVIFNNWYGNNTSVCVETQGRELLRAYRNCRWTGDIPLYINVNPNTSPAGYLSSDHFTFYDLYLSSTNQTTPLIKIEDGVHLSSTAFINNSWNGGKYGIYWNDTSATATSEGLTIINSRKEQNFDTNGYALYLSLRGTSAGGANLQGLNLFEFTMDGDCNGIYARNVTTLSMIGCSYPGAHTFIDIVGKPSTTTMSWQNMTFLNGLVDGVYRPLVSIIGMKEKHRPGKAVSNDPLPATAFFEATGTTNYVYLPGQNWQGAAGSSATLNATDLTTGAVESSVVGVGSSGTPGSGFGPMLSWKAHNSTNGVATVGEVEAVWTTATAGGERGRIGFSPMSTNGTTPLLYLRGDGRVLFPQGWLQVDDFGAPLKVGTSGGIDFESGSVWPNLFRNQTHGGLEVRIWNGSDYIVPVTVNGSDRNVYLGEAGHLLPKLYFWPDSSGAYIAGLGQGVIVDAKLGAVIVTNASGVFNGAPGWYQGSGDPNGNSALDGASLGSFYSRTAGGAGTSFYVKEVAGAAGWSAK